MKSLKIFVADDNPGDVLLLSEVLKEHKIAHRLLVENDGAAAIHFIAGLDGKACCPDLFVIDLRMPKASGLDVVKSIRKSSCFSHQPIILMSSVLTQAEQHDIQTMPACYFFRKPLLLGEWSEVIDFIRKLCAG